MPSLTQIQSYLAEYRQMARHFREFVDAAAEAGADLLNPTPCWARDDVGRAELTFLNKRGRLLFSLENIHDTWYGRADVHVVGDDELIGKSQISIYFDQQGNVYLDGLGGEAISLKVPGDVREMAARVLSPFLPPLVAATANA